MTAIDSPHDGAMTHRANLNIAAAVVARLGMGASDTQAGRRLVLYEHEEAGMGDLNVDAPHHPPGRIAGHLKSNLC